MAPVVRSLGYVYHSVILGADLPFAGEWHPGRGVCHVFNYFVMHLDFTCHPERCPSRARAVRTSRGTLCFLNPISAQGVLNRFRNSSAVSPATRIIFLR